MEFNVIGFEKKEEWERITKRFEVYYQWQYVDAFYQYGDGIPKLAYARSDSDYVAIVFLLRDINKDLKIQNTNQYYDIITPYGYGGVTSNGNNSILLDFFFERFEEYCKNNAIVSEFLRLCPFTNNYSYYRDDYEILKISKIIFMKLDSPEQIWNDMEGRCRTSIRKAMNNDLVVKSGFSKKMIEEFKTIYYDTMSRDVANNYYYFNDEFFNSIYNNLKDFCKIYTVYFDDKAISSSIILYNGTNAHYHLSGTLSEYMKYGANNLALNEIALDLCKNGYKTFHLGGGYGGDNSPLLKFKKSFNKNGELDFYIGRKIYNQSIYKELCDIMNVDSKIDFFPAYRYTK
ncbi:MAG: GNAT family N-acetyltransferase [Clostridia bacterium]|nr:GNAT family N-acetyltransferase [Clostridia bacterium]